MRCTGTYPSTASIEAKPQPAQTPISEAANAVGTWQREEGGVEADGRQAEAGDGGLDGALGLLRFLLHHRRRVALEQLRAAGTQALLL